MSAEQEVELNDYMREENDFFIDNERNRQQQIINKQDEQLDKLHENVKTVHEIGVVINREIDQQDLMLDQMSEKVEHTDGRLVTLRKKIDQVIERSSSLFISVRIG